MDYRKLGNSALSFLLAFVMVMTPLLSAAEPVIAEEAEESSKTEYVFENDDLKAEAVLSEASSIPDDAEFKVSQITEKTDRDSYDAYMKALNKGTDISYDSTNTLLYDFAFIKDGAEIEPEEGKVSVSVQFKKSQLVKGIGAENETDFHVIHLPVKDTDEIKVSDIKKEELSSSDVDIDASKEEVKFVTESFSTFAYSTANAGSDGSVTVNVNLQKNGSNVSSAQIDSGKYFVYIEGPARRASDGQQQTGFLLAPLTDAGNGVATLKINDLGQNGSAFGPMIDGQNYTLKLYRLQDGKTARNIYQSGQPDQNDYKEVTGDLMLTAGSKSYKPEVPSTLTLSNGEIIINAQESKDPNAVDYGDFTDKISIVNINTVLGRAVEYGILAEEYRQTVHTETNWAVNKYDRVGDIVTDPDLGTNTESAEDTGYPFIMTEMTNGFRVGSTTVGTMSIYTSDEYAGHPELFRTDTPNVTLKKYFRDRAVVKADVDAMIGKIRDESDALAAKNTITVPDGAIGNNNHFTIDTTGYADDDVIYVSVPAGSKLEDIIKTTEGLTIKKSANQMIVFNFETTGTVDINKIAVEVNGQRVTSDTVNQELDNQHNKDVDNYIIRKIIWNANQASKLNVDMGAGMFLVPRGDAHCQNASAGWLATGGTVTANGEWHFAFRQRQFMTDGSIKFEGRKELVSYKDDGTAVRLPISQNQFKFTLYQTDETYDTTGNAAQIVQEHLGNSATSAVQFQDLDIKEADLEYDAATGKSTKVLYYVVREELPDGTVPELYSSQSVNGVDYWTGDLRVKITATLHEAPEGSGGENEIQFTVSSWKYDSDGTLISSNNEIVATTQVFTFGAFPNKTSDKKVSLKATKSFTGKTWDNETFKFKLDKVSAIGADGVSIPEDQIPMPDQVTETASSSHQTATFGAMEYNLPGTYVYTITELPPDGTEVPEGTTSVTVDGITYDLAPHTVTVTVTQTADGALEASADYGDGTSGLTVTNTYSSQHTELSFRGKKSIEGRLFQAGDRFTFRISGEGDAPLPTDNEGRPITTVNVAPILGNTTVDFNFPNPIAGSVKYTEADLGKTYKYTVTEEATISGVTNDARVHTVTVTITKDNDGKLVATPTYSDGNELHFINNYHANEVSIGLSGTKTWNKLLEGNDFSFTITEVADQEGTPIQPAEGETVYTETVKNDEDGNFTFSDITFYEVGTHYYKVVEENAGQKVNGTTHDSRSYITKIVVTDDGQGSLRAKLDDTASNIKFSNTYEAAGDVELEAKKVLNGRDLKAGEFSFQLKDSDGKVIQTKQNAADGTVKFDEISYTYADLDKSPIKYTINEVKGSLGGVKYDEHTEEIEVTLTDNGDGTITATPNKTGAEVEFKNEYSAEGSAVVGAKKVLSGKALTANQFQFQLLAADKTTVLQTKSNAEDGTVTFDTIEYSLKDVKNSPITYYLKEVPGSDPAYSYDPELKAVTVTLTDDGDGHISTHVNPSSDSIVFSNTYGADGEVRLEALKVQTGKTLKGGEYSFELKDANGAVLQTKTNDADGKVVFDAITYNQDDLANSPFTYTINEVKGDKAGIKYDEHVETITVTLKDKGGKIEATPNKNGAQVKFENEYKAEGEVQLKAKKVLTGKTLPEGEFTFELKDSTGKVLQSKTNAEDGTVTFDKISYTEEDLAKSPIKYTISERAGDKPYYTYDDHEVEVNVTLEDDDEDGNITVVPDKTEAEVKFENEYKAEGEVQLKAKKVLTGKTLPEGEFTFELKDSTGKVLQSKTNAEDGTVTFDKISYTEEDLVKSPIEYTISERAGDKPYYTYDNHEETIKVTLEDNGNGTITATPDKNGAAVKFTNDYHAKGKVVLGARKTLDGKTLEAGKFAFDLKDSTGKLLQEVTNAADGTVTFDEIKYTEADLKNSPIKYTINEVDGREPGYTYDTTPREISVTLTDKGDGEIEAVASPKAAEVTFANTYGAAGQVQLKALKVLKGTELTGGEFEFELKDETGKVIQTKTNDASGKVIFDPITYSQNDLVNSPFTYRITEVKGNKSYYTYDTHEETIEVTLEDKGGRIEATPNKTEAQVKFENEYTASGKVQLEAKKVLNGRDLKNKEFTFELKDATGKVLQSKTNAADGTVKFDEIEYSLDDVKKSPITYTISEVKGSLGGITYAENKETINVELTDNGNGTITATPDKNGTAVKFVNDYHADATDAQFKVSKKTTGQTGSTKTFEFTIKPVSEDAKDTEKADKYTSQGTVSVTGAADKEFDKITYSAAGTYEYEISETKGDAKGYTYDQSVYKAVVTVTDNETGQLQKEVIVTKIKDPDGKDIAEAEQVETDKATVDFDNKYKADSTEVKFSIQKELKDAKSTDKEFSFRLKAADENAEKVLEQDDVKNITGAGKVDFDAIEFHERGTYTFKITEDEKQYDDFIFDKSEYTAVVTITDNDSGTLQKDVKITKTKDADGKEIAEPEEVDGLTVTFTNTRKKAKILLTKTIDEYYDAGDKTNASMVFTVTYKDAEGNTVSRNANVQYDAESDTTQIVEMDDIPLDTDLEITEIYSGNYKPVEGTKTLTKDDVRLIDGEYVYTVTFENKLIKINRGFGIINMYKQDADGNFVIEHRVGIDE